MIISRFSNYENTIVRFLSQATIDFLIDDNPYYVWFDQDDLDALIKD